MLTRGDPIPHEFTRPEVAEILPRRLTPSRPRSPDDRRSHDLVHRTSGAGKSTIGQRVATELRDRGLRVEVLDGDEVRQTLSAGLGFSKEDRDVNIRRIGFVAELLSPQRVVAITAAISRTRTLAPRCAGGSTARRGLRELHIDVLSERTSRAVQASACR